MPDDISEYNQASFVGGMNLLGDDSRLQPNQYRIGFDMTNRFDELDLMLAGVEDTGIPGNGSEVIQEITSFGNYIILFIGGFAYYRYYNASAWQQVDGFQMSRSAPRYWTCSVPVSTTNYVRLATTPGPQYVGGIVVGNPNTTNPAGEIATSAVNGAAQGNAPGLLVQDNINQPQFIFLDAFGIPSCFVTQTYQQWQITFTDATNVTVASNPDGSPMDSREYVPIGNSMAWANGILFVVAQDFNSIYRSVSGRPLDFVIDVPSALATSTVPFSNTYFNPITRQNITTTYNPFTMIGGGDATQTSYSVGVGGISCIRPLSTGGIFVSASNANFAVTLNTTPGASTIFGEYTFLRQFLFNATCLTDRGILDTVGDTRFIDITGVRSFNAVEQEQNEGRNSVFTSQVQKAFDKVIQSSTAVAAILYDNYEMYAMNTIFGFAIAKYDTVNSCWVGFDIQQTGGIGIKAFMKLEIDVQRLYAVTTDNRLINLYAGPDTVTGTVRTVGVCASMLYANMNIKMNNPKSEVKLQVCRVVMNNITDDATLTFTPYVNNRLTSQKKVTKTITYTPPTIPSSLLTDLPDVDTQLTNLYIPTPNCGQGWKMFGVITWDEGSITQYSMELQNVTPMNPQLSQVNTQ